MGFPLKTQPVHVSRWVNISCGFFGVDADSVNLLPHRQRNTHEARGALSEPLHFPGDAHAHRCSGRYGCRLPVCIPFLAGMAETPG